MYLTEVMLPLNDMRLDFVMGDWEKTYRDNLKKVKNNKIIKQVRKGVI